MSSLGSPSPFLFGGAAPSYDVDRSLRFSGVGETRLNYTPASGGNKKTWTFSWWLKRGSIERKMLFGSYNSGATTAVVELQDDHQLNFYDYNSGYRINLETTQVFRDPSAWYHFVIALDTTQSTDSNRVKIYVNGSQITDFASALYPSQNFEGLFNDHTIQHAIGTEGSLQRLHFDGYMAEVYFLDGYAYDSSYFGETNATTGQWIPKEYTGSFGNNGYYLKFADNSSTSALGTDSSGNGNNLTPVNFSVTAGKTDDSFFDTPTKNFATLSPIDRTYTTEVILSEANTRWQYNYKPASKTVRATMALPSTGKIYIEWENEQPSSQGGRMSWGLVRYNSEKQNYDVQAYNDVDYVSISFGGSIWVGTTNITAPASFSAPTYYTGERSAMAIDCSTGDFWLGKVASNGSTTWYANDGGTDGDPAAAINKTGTLPNFTTATEWIPFVGWHDGGAASSTTYYANINFGNHSFLGTAPTGFTGLSSDVLATPTIKLPNKYFDTLLYSGNESGQSITGLNFAPDWVWIKKRNESASHCLFDSLRGATKRLKSDNTDTELTQTDSLTAFNSDGFTLGGNGHTSENGDTFVAWNWDAGETDSKTYTVTVVSDSGNKYRFDGFGTSAVTLDLAEGGTYTFNYPSAHPLRFSTTSDGTHGGGSEYTTGVSSYGNSVTITVADSAPQLFYFCTQHSGMGGAINTNSTLGSSNFDGSNQTTVKASPTSGFSIIKYTGTGSLNTIGHGLGVVPNVYIIKNRDASDNWIVYTTGIDGSLDFVYLNLDNTKTNSGNTAPTSSVIEISGATTNDSGNKHICYAFSEVAGYSKFGSYTANGSSSGISGPFIYTGFAPAWVMTKRTNSSASWEIHDNKRPAYNPHSFRLLADGNNSEATSNHVDFVSNGFKIRNTYSGMNGSNGDTYIYLAFASAPFKYANAR